MNDLCQYANIDEPRQFYASPCSDCPVTTAFLLLLVTSAFFPLPILMPLNINTTDHIAMKCSNQVFLLTEVGNLLLQRFSNP